MAAPGAFHAAPGPGPQPVRGEAGPTAEATTWKGVIDRALDGLAAAAGARLRVFRLEVQRAMQVSAAALVLGAVTLLLLLTAWFALVGAIVAWAVLAGFQWPWVLLTVAAVCVLLAWLGLRSARASFGAINFDATTRVLRRGRAAGTGETSREGAR